ncbi:MAG TPA: GspE/PulE family protein [Thermoanaerobaculia bacterium]|nr:GspE/PulE family protein [Thermoanaerobaculia bacterium]
MSTKQVALLAEKRVAAAPADEHGHASSVVDQYLRAAAAERASDIHLEPKDDHVRVRFRIEGVLQERKGLPPDLGLAVISRLKMLGGMDMAERRIPQDGRFSSVLAGTERTVRASVFPTIYGEKIVLRISSPARALRDLSELGMPEPMIPVIRQALNRPSGMILTTGPSSSGRTSTLYSLIQLLDSGRRNIVTLEEGIEERLPSLTQGETNPRAGFTLASGLAAIEGQDPDVILVAELGDVETAAGAFRLAMSGRLVLSSLLAGSTVETITRLLDMGLEPFSVASGLSILIAQRLVRRLCEQCRVPVPADAGSLAVTLGFLPAELPETLYAPKGCELCGSSGYRGRVAIFEVVAVDDEIRDSIRSKSPTRVYRQLFASRQIPGLRREGWNRVRVGETTIDEVIRVC